MASIMSSWRAEAGFAVAAAALLLSVAAAIDQARSKPAGHEAGLLRYARVERPDGAYREMLVDLATLERLRQGQPPGDGATLLMESYYQPGIVGSVFVKRRVNGVWRYGTVAAGDASRPLREQSQCRGCHVAASAKDGIFMLDILKAFARDRTARSTRCEQPGRTPCGSESYSPGQSRPIMFDPG
jgi:hypothetical protein